MRFLKKFGIGIVAIVLLLFVIFIVGYLFRFPRADGVDTFYILNAEMDDPLLLYKAEEKLEKEKGNWGLLNWRPGIAVHWLKKGNGTIIAYREFSEGDPYAIDDETFEKITIWLSENILPENKTYAFRDNNSVVIAYTKGASAWPWTECFGYLKDGFLKIKKQNSQYQINIKGSISTSGMIRNKEICQRLISRSFTADEIDIDQLTPWLGEKTDKTTQGTSRGLWDCIMQVPSFFGL